MRDVGVQLGIRRHAGAGPRPRAGRAAAQEAQLRQVQGHQEHQHHAGSLLLLLFCALFFVKVCI